MGEADEGGGARVEIVHEALIRHWGALAGWLEEDVEGQRLTHALRQAAREWETRRRPRGLLWRGDALADLRRFRKRATDRLTGEEGAFVEASEADERRGSRIRRGLIAGAFVATGAFGAFMFFQWRAAEDARVEADRQRAQAEVRGLVSEARNQEPAGNLGEALALLRAATSIEEAGKGGAPTLVSLDMERLGRAGVASRVLSGHAWGLMRLAISPDGKHVATAARDGAVGVWDLATGALVRVLDAGTDPILAVAYSPDGKTIVTANGNATADAGVIRVWDVAKGAVLYAIEIGSIANDVAFSPDGKLIASCSSKDGAALWDAETGNLAAPLGDPVEDADRLQFSADGSLVWVRSGKEVHVYAAPSGALVATLSGHERSILGTAFSHSGALIATASVDGTMRVWDARTGAEKAKLAAEKGSGYSLQLAFHAVAWSPDDRLLAVGAKDGSVRLADAASGAVLHTLSHHSSQIEGLAFSPDGARVASASLDGSATVWEAKTGALVEALRGHREGLCCVAFAGNDRVVTGSEDRTARIWQVGDGPFVRMLAAHTRSVIHMEASAGGSILATSSNDGTVRIWEPETGAVIATLGDHRGTISALALSPDGKAVVTGALKSPARLWDARSGAMRFTLGAPERVSNAAAFSPDGALVATAEMEGPVHLWDAATGAEKRTLSGHDKKVARIAFSHDGKKLVSASWDGTARVWDVAGKAEPLVLKSDEGWVTVALFSPDDWSVAIAANEEARIYEAATGDIATHAEGPRAAGQCARLFAGRRGDRHGVARRDAADVAGRHGRAIACLHGPHGGRDGGGLLADGERLYSAGDSTIRVWHAASERSSDILEPHRTDETLRGAVEVLPLGKTDVIAASAQDGSVALFRTAKVDRARTLSATGSQATTGCAGRA